jgi:hypothetical protein
VVFGALAGGLLTVLAGWEPGWLLGLFVLAATAVGASAVRRGSAHLVIPVPAVAYFIVAILAGLIHDRSVDTTRAILAVSAVQWMAGGFLWMCLATGLAIAITAGRWLMTGRAAYGSGGHLLARFGGPWSAPATARSGDRAPGDRTAADRVPGDRPAGGPAPPGTVGTERPPAGGSASLAPGHEELDTEHSAEA